MLILNGNEINTKTHVTYTSKYVKKIDVNKDNRDFAKNNCIKFNTDNNKCNYYDKKYAKTQFVDITTSSNKNAWMPELVQGVGFKTQCVRTRGFKSHFKQSFYSTLAPIA